MRHLFLSIAVFLSACQAPRAADETPWRRHAIDASSRGADGVRLTDVDGDGRLDIATGWEEGGLVRVYRHPGVDAVKEPWPAVTVGKVASPEDAVFVDLNRDGAVDVVSCCEGRTRDVFLHLAPAQASRYWEAEAWTSHALVPQEQAQSWMFCLPLDGRDRPALIVGSKGEGASVSRLTGPAAGAGVAPFRVQRLTDAGWIMSLRATDMDGDGDQDVLYSDRKGPRRGIHWLQQPADPDRTQWRRHTIGGTGREVMFLNIGDLTGDGVAEIVAATRSEAILVYEHSADGEWTEQTIPMPPGTGSGKGVAIGDVDRDGRADLVISCESSADRHGLFRLSPAGEDLTGEWTFHPISGRADGIKFDRIELLDLDEDGDLDVLTCEERDNLGVIWYENPLD